MRAILLGATAAAFLAACAAERPLPESAGTVAGSAAPAAANYDYDVEARLVELGIQLPAPPPPVANYVRATRSGNIVYLAGHGPDRPDGTQVVGKLGAGGLSVAEGQEAARLTGIGMLASLKAEIGDLNRVSRILKVTGLVNAHPDFTDHPQVMNGFSDLMVQVFGERGRHARTSVGMGSLPNDIAVEIDMIVEISD